MKVYCEKLGTALGHRDFAPLMAYKSDLEKFNVRFVDNESEADLSLTTPSGYTGQRPTLLFDFGSTAHVNEHVEKLVSDDTVKFVVKHVVEGDRHKVRPGWSLCFFNPLARSLSGRWNLFAGWYDIERTFDLSFAGRIGYADLDLTSHRWNACLRAMESPCFKVIYYRWFDERWAEQFPKKNSAWFRERELDPIAYLKLLASSKMALSPLGKAPICYRDYEAMLSGCVLIKPHTDCRTWPDLTEFEYCKTDHDFSDLHTHVRGVLSDWQKWEEIAFLNRRRLMECLTEFPRRMANLFEEALSG